MRKTLKWKDKTCHKLKKNVQNVSEFKKIKFRKMRFEKFYYVKRHFLLFLCSFEKQDLIFRTSQCVRLKKKLIERVSFRGKRLKTCQKLKKVCIQRSLYESCYPEKTTFSLHFPCCCEMHEIKKKFFYASKFCNGIRKKVCIRKITFWNTLFNENDLFDLFCISLKNLFLNKHFYDASDFQIKK